MMKQSTTAVFPHKRAVAAILLTAALAACSGDKPETMIASARDYMAKGDYKAVVIQVKNALQQNTELPEARYLLGIALLRQGDVVGAETELRRALSLGFPKERVVPPLAQAMLALGQAKKLIEEFGNLQLDPPAANAELLTGLSIAYQATGDSAQAQAKLAAALQADPAHVPALIAQARLQAGKGDFDGALASIDAIVAKHPDTHDAFKLKGDILMAGKNQPDAALDALRQAAKIKPDFILARLAIVNVLIRQGKLDEVAGALQELKKFAPNHPQTRYYETLLAFQKRDLKQAKEHAQQLIKIAPDNVQVLVLAGAIELQSNATIQAETYLAKAVHSAPEFLPARQLLVTTYLRSGQPEKALATLQPLLKGDDQDTRIHSLAGEVYLQNGDVNKAEEHFAKAAKQDPGNTRARTALALTHLASGKDAGFGELQAVAAADTGVTADLALISVYLRRNEFDKALIAIAGLEKKQPDKPLAPNLRGRTLLAKKDTAGARKAFERSLSLDPGYFPSVASLAALDVADKKSEDARKRFEAVLAKNPQHPQALLALAELRAREGGTKEEVVELINKAVAANPTEKLPRMLLVDLHLRNKDNKLALSAAQSAVSAIPDSAELMDALGRAQLASGDTNQALISFNKAATLQPNSPLRHMRIAEAYMLSKDKNAAAQSLRKALDIKPDLVDAQKGLILLALDAKNYADASKIARDIQKQRPKIALGYQFEGDVAMVQSKWDAAADAYRSGLKQGAFPELAVKLYSVLKAAGKATDAEKLAVSWVKEHPKDAVFQLFLANEALGGKDFPRAEQIYRDVIKFAPQHAIAYNNLAWVAGQLKRNDAIALAHKAIELVPNQPAFMDTLAMLLSDSGDHAKALDWQNKAVALQPQNPVYRLNLAKIHIKGGKKDLARKELDELAKLGDKFAGQKEVAELIKSL